MKSESLSPARARQLTKAIKLLRALANCSECSHEGQFTCRNGQPERTLWCATCDAHQFLEQFDKRPQ